MSTAGIHRLPLISEIGKAGRDSPWTLATSVVVLSVSIGIAAAMIGLLDSLLFKPPSGVVNPAGLVNVNGSRNYIQFVELAERSTTLDLASYTQVELSLGVGSTASLARVECVTEKYYDILGTPPAAGRFFNAADEEAETRNVAVVSHAVWRQQFGESPSVLGASVFLAGQEFAILGVAPPGFRGVELGQVDVWILLRRNPRACSFTGTSLLQSSGGSWLNTVGRLREHATLVAAETDTSRILEGSDPSRTRPGPVLQPLQDARIAKTGRSAVLARWMGVGALLLFFIACLNVSGLAVAQTGQRAREIAIRLHLGATRARIVRELLVSSATAPLIATVPAVIVAEWTTRLSSTYFEPITSAVWFSGRALGLMIVLVMLAALLSGITPALYGSRTNPGILFGSLGLNRRGPGLQRYLIVLQVAISFVVVAGAVQFSRSARSIKSETGFDFENTVVVSVDLTRAGYQPSEANRIIEHLVGRLQHVHGIASATISSPILGSSGASLKIRLRLPQSDTLIGSPLPFFNAVGPQYFATVGTRILRGRAFSPADTAGSMPVVVLNEAHARQLSAGELVGECVVIGQQACVIVVGISENRRHSTVTRMTDEFFVPFAQARLYLPRDVSSTVIVRAVDQAHTIVPRIMSEVFAAFPMLPFVKVVPLEDLVDTQARPWRAAASLFSLFGSGAVALSMIGLYSVVVAVNRRRTKEIAMRIAVGAKRADIAALVMRQATVMTLVGVVIGGALTVAVARVWQPLLFEVRPDDPLSFTVAAIVIAVASLMGGALPAIQAARLDPIQHLKEV